MLIRYFEDASDASIVIAQSTSPAELQNFPIAFRVESSSHPAVGNVDGDSEREIVFGSDEVADVTGAGDTVLAVMTAALAAGAEPFEAAVLANIAAGLVVMKLGTATVTADELRAAVAFSGESGDPS